jgi:hypothetical protein
LGDRICLVAFTVSFAIEIGEQHQAARDE